LKDEFITAWNDHSLKTATSFVVAILLAAIIGMKIGILNIFIHEIFSAEDFEEL
jgi:hypothetical protein